MASVWVIEEGEYSDYHIVGIFSTKEIAEEVLATLPSDHYYESAKPVVVEWPLDPFIGNLRNGLKPYTVYMLQNGDVEKVEEEPTDYDIDFPKPAPQREYLNTFGEIVSWPANIYGTVLAKHEKHAIKIVNEARIQAIAGGWPEPVVDKEVILKRSNPTTYRK